VNTLFRDFSFAVRVFRTQPSFTIVALLTLALGIGATTAIFSVVNAVILRPLPFPESHRLVMLYETNEKQGWRTFSVAPGNYADWARDSRTFQSMAAIASGTAAVIVGGEAEQVPATTATAELFTVVRGVPLHGRVFAPGDDVPGAPSIAVISHGFWKRRFGADPAVVGRVVTINERPTTIVGVMTEGFGRGSPDTDIWLPLPIDRANAPRGGRTWNVIGRLADGATIDQARSEMSTIAANIARAFPSNAGWGVNLIPLEEAAVGRSVRRALTLLLGSVMFVLVIACVNIANLLSARGVSRQREFAIRSALGAGRGQLVRQLLTESVVLAAAGGVLGVFVAVWATRLLLSAAPPSLPRLYEVNVDARVLAAALAATLMSALVFGVVSAAQSIMRRPDEALKDTTLRGTETPLRRRMSNAIVVGEVAIAVVLLVYSGLLVRSFVKLTSQPVGFNAENTLVFGLNLPESKYPTPEAVTTFYSDVLDRIRAIPGVVAAGGTHALPFSGMNSVRPFVRGGEPLPQDPPTAEYRLITPGYFAAMGIPVVRGREFTSSDALGQPGAIIVSEAFVQRFLPGVEPLGQSIRQAGGPDLPWLTVVGVVGDVRHFGLAADIQPEMFWPAAQATWGQTLNRLRRVLTVVVRVNGDPNAMIPAIKAQVTSIDPNRPLIDVKPMQALVARSADLQRFSMELLTLFAVVGLVLAAAGVYGVTSFAVAARRREMGIRLALGARPRTLLLQVLRSGTLLGIGGAAIGLAVAWVLGDVLNPQLFETPPHDTLTFVVVGVILFGTAVVACVVPARRAARVDPIEALRVE
jgi:putative ABC transport system permease protein